MTTEPGAARPWNGAVNSRPARVVRCGSAADVRSALLIADENNQPVSVRGGGHDWAGRSFRDGEVILDLSGLRQVSVDAGTWTATMGGGATAAGLIAESSRYGLVTATGTSAGVGMAGLAMGGGYGPGTAKYGLALDNVLAAEVVLADGRIVTTDADTEPDLFWAIRGGGGNFGVVTSLTMRLHPLGNALAGFLMFSPDDAARVWTGIERVLLDAPDDLSVDTGFVSTPDGAPAILVSPTWLGDPAAGQHYIDRLSRLGTLYASQIGPAPWAALIGFVDTIAPAGLHYAIRTRSVPEFTDGVVDALIEAGKARTSPMSTLPLHCFRGQATRPGPSATAFALRTPHFMVEIIAAWSPGDADPARHRRWAEETAAALTPHALPGGYVNLLGPDETARAGDAFGDNTGRLLTAKAKYDPDNVFRAVPLPPHPRR